MKLYYLFQCQTSLTFIITSSIFIHLSHFSHCATTTEPTFIEFTTTEVPPTEQSNHENHSNVGALTNSITTINGSDSTNKAVWSTYFVKPSESADNKNKHQRKSSTTTKRPSSAPITYMTDDETFHLRHLIIPEETEKSGKKSIKQKSRSQQTEERPRSDEAHHHHQQQPPRNDKTHFGNVDFLLNKIFNKVMQSHGGGDAAVGLLISPPPKTIEEIELPDKSKLKIDLRDLLHMEESVQNEDKTATSSSKAKEYFINIPPQTIPIRIRFNTKTSLINAEQNHVTVPGKMKKLFTVEQPDRLIHTVKKPVIQEIHEVILPYRTRIQTVKPVMESNQIKIAKDSRDMQSGSQHGQNQNHQMPQPQAQKQYQQQQQSEQEQVQEEPVKVHNTEFDFEPIRGSTTMAPTRNPVAPIRRQPQFQSEAITQTHNLSTDIELDKIIAKLIQQQEETMPFQQNQGKVVFNNNRFSNVEFSKPDNQQESSTRNSEKVPVDSKSQLKFYKQLTNKLKVLLEKDPDSKIDESQLKVAFSNPDLDQLQKRQLNNIEFSDGFVPITPAPILQPLSETRAAMRDIPVHGVLKLSKVFVSTPKNELLQSPPPTVSSEFAQPETTLDDPLATHENEETDDDEPEDMLGSGSDTEEEVVEVLDSPETNKIPESSMEFVNSKIPIKVLGDGRQMVEEFRREVMVPDNNVVVELVDHGPTFSEIA